MKITLDRLIEGTKPTKREHWGCFHRLFRLARKADEAAFQNSSYKSTDGGAVDCLRLVGYRRWVDLMVGVDHRDPLRIGSPARFCLSKELRRSGVERARSERLYGEAGEFRGELLPKDRAIARVFAEERGVELTPLEAAEERHRVFRKIRGEAERKGVYFSEGPAADVQVLRLLRQLGSNT